MNLDKEPETQSDFDMDAATADISSELFGQSGDEGDKSTEEPAEGEEPEDSATVETGVEKPASPQPEKPEGGEAPSGDDNSAAVQEVGAPKTWTKAALEKWATIDPLVQQEILKREDDFFRGIGQYKAAADIGVRYSQVAQPYAAQLAAHNIDPVQLFQSFAANHYLLSFGKPEQKLDLVSKLIQNYGIDFGQLSAFMADVDTSAPDPQIVALQNEIASLRQGLNQTHETQLSVARDSIVAGIEAFATDPSHPYFDELADDIQRLIETGSAQSLEDAYNTAVYANPVTRQKEVDRLLAEKTSATAAQEQARKDKKADAMAANVTADSQNRNGTEPVGTIDETLEKTMREIQARG